MSLVAPPRHGHHGDVVPRGLSPDQLLQHVLDDVLRHGGFARLTVVDLRLRHDDQLPFRRHQPHLFRVLAFQDADDAFAGLHIMEDLATSDGKRDSRLKEGRTVKEYAKAAAVDEETGPVFAERSPVVGDAPNIPTPPFWGVRVRKDFDLREIFQYINETALFKNQWQLKTASQQDYLRLVEEKFRPIKKQLEEEIIASGVFDPKVVYGYFPCQSDGNDVVVYDPLENKDDHRGHGGSQRELLRFTFPRQR